jgi:hypothetical protein
MVVAEMNFDETAVVFARHSREGGNPVTFVQIAMACPKIKDAG